MAQGPSRYPQDHRVRRIVALLFLSCFAVDPLAAEPAKLDGEAIKTAFTGSQLELDTPLGTTVSIRFTPDGMMSGDAKTLASLLGAATDRGRWWIANNQLCYKWFRWFDAEPRCLEISQEAQRVFWRRDDGESGTATITEQMKPAPKPAVQVSIAAVNVISPAKPVAVKIEHREPPKPVHTEVAKAATTSVVAEHAKPTRTAQATHQVKPSIVATAAPAKEERMVELRVPVPRPAVRPKPRLAAAAPSKPEKLQPPTIREAKSFSVAGVDTFDVLNIRSGPSADYDAVGDIPPNGHGIVITGQCQGDWCPIKHRDRSGWVNRHYLEEEDSRDSMRRLFSQNDRRGYAEVDAYICRKGDADGGGCR
jgi:hypothetical protein